MISEVDGLLARAQSYYRTRSAQDGQPPTQIIVSADEYRALLRYGDTIEGENRFAREGHLWLYGMRVEVEPNHSVPTAGGDSSYHHTWTIPVIFGDALEADNASAPMPGLDSEHSDDDAWEHGVHEMMKKVRQRQADDD